MEATRFKPRYDKSFLLIWVPTLALITAMTVISAFSPYSLFITVPVDILVLYFLFSSVVGYVEMRQDGIFIKCGFFIKREIAYEKIRGVSKERKIYADSTVSIKNSLEHVNIKYNLYDVISVSVDDNDKLVELIAQKLNK